MAHKLFTFPPPPSPERTNRAADTDLSFEELCSQTPSGIILQADAEDFSAWFTCALAVAWPHGPAVVVEGRVDGSLVFPGRGDQGHGYDPIFMAKGHDITFGEMDPVEKDRISHRAQAFAKLKAALL